jgi:hypothetical protein
VKQVQRHFLWVGVAKNVHINSGRQRTLPNARGQAQPPGTDVDERKAV